MNPRVLCIIILCFSSVSLVQAVCTTQNTDCGVGFNEILRLSAQTNAHLQQSSVGTYPWRVCCDTFTLTTTNPQYTLLDMSATTNAHAKTSSAAGSYPFEVNVSAPINYRYGADCNAGDSCVVKLSDYTNAHAEACSQTNYPLRVCAGSSGSTLDMLCGNVTVENTELDPACEMPDPSNPPSTTCAENTACVYADEATGTNPQCYTYGTTIVRSTISLNITCSENNTWCPEGIAYNETEAACVKDIDFVCDEGFATGMGIPELNCSGTDFVTNTIQCLWDFVPPAMGPLPMNQSCDHTFNWTLSTIPYFFYNPHSITII